MDLYNEMEDVSVQNLVPKRIAQRKAKRCFQRLKALDVPLSNSKKILGLMKSCGMLQIWVAIWWTSMEPNFRLGFCLSQKDSVLGQLKGSDSLFEIYTDSYGAHPIVIQGAGAGAKVTARGYFGDLLRLSEKNIMYESSVRANQWGVPLEAKVLVPYRCLLTTKPVKQLKGWAPWNFVDGRWKLQCHRHHLCNLRSNGRLLLPTRLK